MAPDFTTPARRRGPDRRAFTLIEVLVAFAVLVPIVVVAAGVLPFFRLSSARAWSQVAAADLGREQMERARASDFDALSSVAEQTETRNGTAYRWSMAVTPVGDGARRKRVVVTVAWTRPQSQSVTFETVVARSAASGTTASTTTTSSSSTSTPGSTSTPASISSSTPTTTTTTSPGNSNGNGGSGASSAATPSPSPTKGKGK